MEAYKKWPCMFKVGTFVKHVKRGTYYMIKDSPATNVIKSTMERAYGYRAYADGMKYQRPQAEMEDGRFVAVEYAEVLQWIKDNRERKA